MPNITSSNRCDSGAYLSCDGAERKLTKSKFCNHIIYDKKNISRCNDNLSLCRDNFPLFRYFLLFCLILKSFGLKGTHRTELFYGVGRGEHIALVPSVRGIDNAGEHKTL